MKTNLAFEICEIFNPETKARCGKQAKQYHFVEADAKLILCPEHLKVWKKRGTMQEVIDPNQETNYDHATMDMEEHGR